MDLNIRGRSAVITGASKGIGRAVAERFAAEGVNVHLVARTVTALDTAVDELKDKYGVDAGFSALDLSVSANVDQLFAKYVGTIDILVNNAGAIPGGGIDRVDEATWRQAWDLKVFGYINTCRLVYDRMRDAGHGVIINIIGAAGERPSPGYIAGAGGNASLMAITRGLGSHSLSDGIRVVAINPGLIRTERLVTILKAQAEASLGDENRWEELIDPVFAPGDPQHIADLAAFLASDLSGNTTGTVFTVDGGSSVR
ncbi:MAG TPA: short-chain dehydrogenase [Gammaproteobacteria bacterium]|jgi:NAD(P)-dependent dehydrogenase (short-subunit alcohol dehydrogenase family)|nr:short-chain dehydrogenase [Gammaproteobacteria bacterium]